MSIPLVYKEAKKGGKATDEAYVNPHASSDQLADPFFASLPNAQIK